MDEQLPSTLIRHLCQTTALAPQEAERLVEEILHYFGDTAEEFIVRRHRHLQQEGFSNAEIYGQITRELATRRFRTPPLSERQIRRVIYG
ncbi:MAG: hypothetical protein KTR32_25220 [Granulosicoccus sp.]|nr:hypothetical protein [Granulosicoccus sp.]